MTDPRQPGQPASEGTSNGLPQGFDRPSPSSRQLAGVLLIVLPTVVYGGTSILSLVINDPAYADSVLRRDMWRAGHAHAGVLLLLALICLRYVDESDLPHRVTTFVRHAVPMAAILLPSAFFLSVLSSDATTPNAMINLAYVGAVVLAAGLLTLGIGLVRSARHARQAGAGPHRASRSR